jgi:hypothetical protein
MLLCPEPTAMFQVGCLELVVLNEWAAPTFMASASEKQTIEAQRQLPLLPVGRFQ